LVEMDNGSVPKMVDLCEEKALKQEFEKEGMPRTSNQVRRGKTLLESKMQALSQEISQQRQGERTRRAVETRKMKRVKEL